MDMYIIIDSDEKMYYDKKTFDDLRSWYLESQRSEEVGKFMPNGESIPDESWLPDLLKFQEESDPFDSFEEAMQALRMIEKATEMGFGQSSNLTIMQVVYRELELPEFHSMEISEMIKKEGNKYNVYTKSGSKKLGSHNTKEDAKKQLAAIEINKAQRNEIFDELQSMIFVKSILINEGKYSHLIGKENQYDHITSIDELESIIFQKTSQLNRISKILNSNSRHDIHNRNNAQEAYDILSSQIKAAKNRKEKLSNEAL